MLKIEILKEFCRNLICIIIYMYINLSVIFCLDFSGDLSSAVLFPENLISNYKIR